MILSRLDDILDKKLGDDWHEWEPETLSYELGAEFDAESLVKIVILKSLQSHPEIVLDDADYFLRFIEVANGNLPDPHHHDIPTTLELDFALRELEHILGDRMEKTSAIKHAIKYIVRDEGHGKYASKLLAKYSGESFTQTDFTKAYDEYAKDMK